MELGDLVHRLGAHFMGAYLASKSDVTEVTDDQLRSAADHAVRAAKALAEALPRHEAKLAAEAEAAEAAVKEVAEAEEQRIREGQERAEAQIRATEELAAREAAEARVEAERAAAEEPEVIDPETQRG